MRKNRAKRLMKCLIWDYKGAGQMFYECNSNGKIILQKKPPRNNTQIIADLEKDSKSIIDIADFPIPTISKNDVFYTSHSNDLRNQKLTIVNEPSYEDEFNSFEDCEESDDTFFSTFHTI